MIQYLMSVVTEKETSEMFFSQAFSTLSGSDVKNVFMLNSAEHEISTAHKN